jgi:serine/threonine protein kinase
MERTAVSVSQPDAVIFRDGLGERRRAIDPTGSQIELLALRSELAAVPSFEFALRERVGRLATFRHAYYGRVLGVERASDHAQTLTLSSEVTPGIRLSELLANTEIRHLPFDINAALYLIRQLVPAVALLHETAGDVGHGSISPERLVITPNGHLVIVEYVLGAALEQLRFTPERYWRELRVAVPRGAPSLRLDQRADVGQLGLVALSLILGRPLRDDEYPSRIGDVVASTWAVSARGGFEPLPPGLRAWLGRALHQDARHAFKSAVEARRELDSVLGDSQFVASPASLEAFLARYHASDRSRTLLAQPAQPQPVLAVSTAKPVIESGAKPAPVVSMPKPLQAAPAQEQAPDEKRDLPKSGDTSTVPGESELEVHLNAPESASLAPKRWVWVAAAAAVLVAVTGAGALAARLLGGRADTMTGTLVVATNPDGAQAFVDGQLRGLTPLSLTLPAGTHSVEFRGDGEPRSLTVTITPGAEVSQYVELPKAVVAVGQLQIRTEPPGARVTVDGRSRGTSPMFVTDLSPGEHSVVLESELGAVRQTVTVEAGATAALVVPMSVAEGAPVSGWVAVSSPVVVQLFERDRLLGSSQSDRIMVSAGRHEIDFVNDAIGYKVSRSLQVAAGKVVSVNLEVPEGTLAVNAVPWAEVWIDGDKVGETPVGNVALPVGQHEVTFRHPELGEQRHTALVTLRGPARLSVDMRRR